MEIILCLINLLRTEESPKEQLAPGTPPAEQDKLVAYAPDAANTYVRVKIVDGTRKLKELDFFVDSIIEETLRKIRFEDVVDGGRITEYTK